MVRKINCNCIDADTKIQIISSNLSSEIKNIFGSIRTCGFISDKDVVKIVHKYKDRPIKYVIEDMKKFGLTKQEIDEKILDMREKNFLELEVGTPIGVERLEELKEITIETEKARFNYAKPTGKAYNIFLK